MHRICFNLDNSFVTIINICSCENCIIGKFLECDKEKGIKLLLSSTTNQSSDKEELGYEELESDFEEMYELPLIV